MNFLNLVVVDQIVKSCVRQISHSAMKEIIFVSLYETKFVQSRHHDDLLVDVHFAVVGLNIQVILDRRTGCFSN